MDEIVWTEPALSELEATAEFIALENPQAARKFVQKVFRRVTTLRKHPEMGPMIPELLNLDHRQISEHPCRIFYRVAHHQTLIIHVLRSERITRLDKMER